MIRKSFRGEKGKLEFFINLINPISSSSPDISYISVILKNNEGPSVCVIINSRFDIRAVSTIFIRTN